MPSAADDPFQKLLNLKDMFKREMDELTAAINAELGNKSPAVSQSAGRRRTRRSRKQGKKSRSRK